MTDKDKLIERNRCWVTILGCKINTLNDVLLFIFSIIITCVIVFVVFVIPIMFTTFIAATTLQWMGVL